MAEQPVDLSVCPDCGGLDVVPLRKLEGVRGFTITLGDGTLIASGTEVYAWPERQPCPNGGGETMATMTEPHLTLYSDGLLSKFGFNDGDDPEEWLDYCDAHGIDYNKVDFPLIQLVRQYLLPVLDQQVTVVEIETAHNPIRARTVDGVEVHGDVTVYGDPIELTPEQVTIPMSEVARLAQE